MSGIGGKAAASTSACMVCKLRNVHGACACMLWLACCSLPGMLMPPVKQATLPYQTSRHLIPPSRELPGFSLSRILIKRAELCTDAALQVQHL